MLRKSSCVGPSGETYPDHSFISFRTCALFTTVMSAFYNFAYNPLTLMRLMTLIVRHSQEGAAQRVRPHLLAIRDSLLT